MEVWVWSVKVGGKRKNTPKTMSLVDQSAVGPRMSAKWKQDRYGRLGVAGEGVGFHVPHESQSEA